MVDSKGAFILLLTTMGLTALAGCETPQMPTTEYILKENSAWFVTTLDGLAGTPISPAMANVTPWLNAAIYVTDGGTVVAARQLKVVDGVWIKSTDQPKASVKISDIAIGELKPYLTKLLNRESLTIAEEEAAANKVTNLVMRGEMLLIY